MKNLFKAMAIALLTMVFNQTAIAAGEHGTADEAMALVKKAAAFMTANGKEKAFAEFNNPSGQFKDRDLYIFVNDLTGKTLSHGGNPKLIDKNMVDLKDMDGKYFIKSFIEVVNTKGSGWVDYKWTNPVSKSIDQKSTYVMKVGDVMIGCGIYK